MDAAESEAKQEYSLEYTKDEKRHLWEKSV